MKAVVLNDHNGLVLVALYNGGHPIRCYLPKELFNEAPQQGMQIEVYIKKRGEDDGRTKESDKGN